MCINGALNSDGDMVPVRNLRKYKLKEYSDSLRTRMSLLI